MKKLMIILILLSTVLLLSANSAVATLLSHKGQLSIQRAEKMIKYRAGELLFNQDTLRTGNESFAAYKYVDGKSTLKLFSNSVVIIAAQKDGKVLKKSANLKKGSLLSHITPKSGEYRVSTPVAVASVKGTEFFSKVEDDGKSTFVVSDGEILLEVIKPRQTGTVRKGETGIVSAKGELEIRNSSAQDLSFAELAELESQRETVIHELLIPVMDKAGNVKYIKIRY